MGMLGSSEQWFNHLIAEDDQCCHRSDALRNGLISGCVGHPPDDLFAAQFLKIVGRDVRRIRLRFAD